LASYNAPRHDLFKLVSITFLPLQGRNVDQSWKEFEMILNGVLREDCFAVDQLTEFIALSTN
jgi:hypothetical protein